MTKIVRALGLSLALVAIAGLAGPPFATGQAKKDKDTKAAGTAVFEVHKSSKNGKFYFSMRDSEGKLLAMCSPSGYETRADCQKAIDTIRNTAAKAKVEFKTESTEDKKPVDKKTEDKAKTKDKKTEDKTKKK
jgi:uncharacterized protein YegP (UPF0339 family)